MIGGNFTEKGKHFVKRMYSLDDEKIEYVHLATGIYGFGRAKNPRMLYLNSDFGVRGIYSSLTRYSANFNQRD